MRPDARAPNNTDSYTQLDGRDRRAEERAESEAGAHRTGELPGGASLVERIAWVQAIHDRRTIIVTPNTVMPMA